MHIDLPWCSRLQNRTQLAKNITYPQNTLNNATAASKGSWSAVKLMNTYMRVLSRNKQLECCYYIPRSNYENDKWAHKSKSEFVELTVYCNSQTQWHMGSRLKDETYIKPGIMGIHEFSPGATLVGKPNKQFCETSDISLTLVRYQSLFCDRQLQPSRTRSQRVQDLRIEFRRYQPTP